MPLKWFLIFSASPRTLLSVAVVEHASTLPPPSAANEAFAIASAPKSLLRSLAIKSGHRFLANTTAKRWNFIPPSLEMRSSKALSMSELRTAIQLLASRDKPEFVHPAHTMHYRNILSEK